MGGKRRAAPTYAEVYARFEPDRLGKRPRMTHGTFFDDEAADALHGAIDGDADAEVIEAARQRVEDTAVRFYFRGLSPTRYNKLLADHPATEQDHERVQARGLGDTARWALDDFPKALILAACVEPALTEDDVDEMWDTWNDAELGAVFEVALAASTTVGRVR